MRKDGCEGSAVGTPYSLQSAMDVGGDAFSPVQLILEQNDGEQRENVNISDVLEAINADPVYGGDVDMARPLRAPSVEIEEQPASKALRFRYPCEGRSAGSLPGVRSTTENKTYPTIRINNYVGKCSVVVSCVTKDEPFRPHPHKLVGRDRCEHGVCTVRADITEECPLVQFRNLGIQCVKKKEVDASMRQRELIRVDPFRTGFEPRSYASIELNSLRLAFQVFLPDGAGNMRQPLPAVCSDVIHDKKAAGDLVIVRASHCSGSARGGTSMVLLTEKVSREDLIVMFFDRSGWEASANLVAVHKQVAIVIDTPPYRDPHTTEHVTVEFRLQRGLPAAEDEMSRSHPFEYLPHDEPSGTARKPPPDLAALAALLAPSPTPAPAPAVPSSPSPASPSPSPSPPPRSPDTIDVEMLDPTEKSLNDLLDQVAELDEIYSENRTRLENVTLASADDDPEDFDDAGTYTSLQLAFRNPVDIAEPYEDVQVHSFRGPIIEFTHLKPESEDAPPLPPKRVRKSSSSFKSSQTSVDGVLKPGKQIPVTRNPEALTHKVIGAARSEPALPPVKKRSLFDRIFRRKNKSPSVASEGKDAGMKPVGRSVSSVSGIRPSKFKSSVSHTSLKDNASAAGLSYADSITHISLHADADENDKSASQSSLRRPASSHPVPPTDGDTILVAESVLALDASAFKKLQDDLELTDAEHYALYMAVAPHATVSEFDETSCYYSPIDGSKFQS